MPRKPRALVFVPPKLDNLNKAVQHLVYAEKLLPPDVRKRWARDLRDLRGVLQEHMAREAGCADYAELRAKMEAVQNGEASPFALYPKSE